jgi:3',5'-nucleoside bisphosphate phosphatase
MAEKLADMHTHTFYSDGTMSPTEILQAALNKGVALLAITDHNILEGTRELKKLCKGLNISYVSGVELDSLDNGINVHILGYGINLESEEFCAFVDRNHLLLDQVNSMLIDKMQDDYDSISYSDYLEYSYDCTTGGWKAIHYLLDRGITNSLRDGFVFYPQYSCTYDKVDFLSVREVCEYIHRAGGKAVLAHPGVTVKQNELQIFEKEVHRLTGYGLDGIECYYPTHTEEVTKICLNICHEQDLLITCGSDCHGKFGTAEVGGTNTPIQQLKIHGLYK